MRLFFIPLVFSVVACDDPTVPPGTPDARRLAVAIEETVAPDAVVDACGDIYFVTHDSDATNAVFITVEDSLAWDASNAGVPLTRTYVLPDPAVWVMAQWGNDLTYEHCNDVLEPGRGSAVDGEAPAVQGTITVTVEPMGPPLNAVEYPGMATIELEDVVFEDADGNQEAIQSIEFPPVSVGWLPG